MKVIMRKYISSAPDINEKIFDIKFSHAYRDKEGFSFGRVEYHQQEIFARILRKASLWNPQDSLVRKGGSDHLFLFFNDSDDMSYII